MVSHANPELSPWQSKGWELQQLPAAQLDSCFPSIAKPGLALLFLGLSQGITLPSLFWEKEAFRSVGALVLSRARGRARSTGDRGRSTHTRVNGPENGEELIPEANLFCSNPAAVTGSPRVLGSGAAADHIAFMPSPSASLSHSPVTGGGEGTGGKGRHRPQRLFTSPPSTRGFTAVMSKNPEGADCRAAA